MRDWVTNVETTHYVLGSAMGPHPYPTIVRDLQRRIGDEAAAQLQDVEGRLPDLAIACVGGGSNAIGLLSRFIGEPSVRLAVAEAAGDGIETGRHAAAILGGSTGILHGSRSLMLQDRDGQVVEAHSASAGLDYPGIGPQLAALAEAGRLEVAAATDREAVAAMRTTTRTEGILPALETAHAIAALPKVLAGVDGLPGAFGHEVLVLLVLRGAATRISRPSNASPTSSPGPSRDRCLAAGSHERDPGARLIGSAFAAAHREGRAALIPYIVAGYPDAETSYELAVAAVDAGADILEIGLPYSDPLADGTTLQRASHAALLAGSTLDGSFALVRRVARARPGIPLVTMGYANQLIGGGDGRERATRLVEAGAAGVIVADMTPDEARRSRQPRPMRGWPSSTSLPPRPARSAAPQSPPGAAGSCTACRWSA